MLLHPTGVGAVEVRDEVGGGFHSRISSPAQVPCRGVVAGCGESASEGIQGEDLGGRIVFFPGVIQNLQQSLLGVPGVVGVVLQ